jgi:hypothetical protein
MIFFVAFPPDQLAEEQTAECLNPIIGVNGTIANDFVNDTYEHFRPIGKVNTFETYSWSRLP